MGLQCEELAIPGVFLFTPQVHGDARGFFLQMYQAREYAAAGLERVFVQDNLSRSRQGTVRGLHYQLRRPQAKLVTVVRGAVLDVAVDVRRGSPTFGRHVAVELSEENRRQLFIPEGFAHGFRVVSEVADFFYKCTDFYVAGVRVIWPASWMPLVMMRSPLWCRWCRTGSGTRRIPVPRAPLRG